MADKLTNNLIQMIGNAGKPLTNYAKNVGTSTYYGYAKIVQNKMPNIGRMVDVNKQTLMDVANVLKNPASLGQAINNKIDTNGILNQSKLILKNAMDDVKTGKFYDPSRDRSEEGMRTAELLDNFGGFDMSGFDDDGGYSEPVSSDADAITSAIQGSTETQEDNADTRFRLQVQSDIGNTQAIIQNDQNIAKLDLKMRLKEHHNTMNMASGSMALQSALVDFHNNQTIQHYNIVKDSLGIVSEAMPKIVSSLTSIEGLLRTKFGDGNNPSSPTKGLKSMMSASDNDEYSPFERGSVSLQKYANHVLRKSDKQLGVTSTLGMILFGMSPTEFMELFKSNPLEEVWKGILESFIPNVTKNMATTLDKSIASFFPALLMKFNAMGKNDGMGNFIAKMFGFEASSRSSIDTRYDMDAGVSFDAVFYKSVVNVIPFRLGQIVSLLSGDRQTIFDHSSGKYIDRADKILQIKEDSESLLGGVSGTTSKFEEMMRGYTFRTKDDEDSIKSDVKKFMQEIIERQELFNPHKATYNGTGVTLKGGDKSFEFIKALFQGLDRHDLLEFNKQSFESLMTRDTRIKTKSDELQRNGLINLLEGGNTKEDSLYANYNPLATAKDREKMLKDFGLSRTSQNHGVSNSANAQMTIPHLLDSILNTLRLGIIVYPKFDSDKDDLDPIVDEVKRISKDLHDKLFTTPNALTESESRQDASDKRKQLEDSEIASGTKTYFSLSGEKMSADYMASKNREMLDKLKTAKEEADRAAIENSEFYKFLDGSKFGKSVLKIKSKVSAATNDPFAFITKAMESVDKKIYSIIYGSEDLEGNINMPFNSEKSDKEDRSIFGKMFNMMKFNFMTFRNFLTNDILDPLHDKLLGENGIFTKLGEKLDPTKQKLKGYAMDKGKDIANYLFGDMVEDSENVVDYKLTADGTQVPIFGKKRSGGVLSSVANKGTKMINNIKSEASKQASSVWTSTKEVLFGKGDVASVNDKDGTISFTQDKGILGGMVSGVMGIKDSIMRTLLGDDIRDSKTGEISKTRSKKMWESMTGEFKGFLPKGITGAGLGVGAYLGSGLLTGLFLPGGPIMAAVLGSSAMFVQHSDKVREYLFGKADGTKDGVINREIVDGFKKFAPKIAIGAGIGAMIKNFGILGTSILPGGPIMGGFLGGIVGLTVASDSLKKALFGENNVGEDGKLTKEFKDKMTDKIATALPMGAGGFMLGSMISNFGILGAIPGMQFLAAGTAIAAMANADDIKAYFFGGKDKDGKPKPGVFDKMVDFGKKEIFDPFINGINSIGTSIQGWFKDALVKPLAEGMGPIKEELHRSTKYIKEAFMNFGGWMKGGMDKVFEENFGAKLEDLLKKYVTDPLKQLFGDIMRFVGKILGGIISMPFKAIGAIGGNLDKKHKRDDFQAAIMGGFASMFKKGKDGKGLIEKMTDMGDNISAGIQSGILKGFKGVMFGFGKAKSYSKAAGDVVIDKSNDIYFKGKGLLGTLKSWITEPAAMQAVREGYGLKSSKTSGNESEQTVGEAWRIMRDDKAKERENNKNIKIKKHAEKEASKLADKLKKAQIKADKKEDKDKHANARKEAAEAESKNRDLSLKKSNNPIHILKGILSYAKNIFNELKGNMNGLGWNLAYIRNILLKTLTGGSDKDLEPNMQKYAGGKPKNIFRKIFDMVSSPFRWIAEKVSDGFEAFKEKALKIVLTVLNPFTLVWKGMKLAWEGMVNIGLLIKDGLSVAIQGLIAIGPAIINLIGTGIQFIGDGIHLGFTTIIGMAQTTFAFVAGIFEGIGKGVGKIFEGIATAGVKIIELFGNFGLLMIDLTRVVLPKLVSGLMDVVGAVGKFLISIPFKIVGGMIDFFTNKINLSVLPFYVNGGHLDFVKVIERIGPYGQTSFMDISPIRIIKGLGLGRPKLAFPVYIAGISSEANMGKSLSRDEVRDILDANMNQGEKSSPFSTLNNTVKSRLDEIIEILIGGHMVTPEGYTVPLAAMSGEAQNSNPFKQFVDTYKANRERLRSASDPGKVLEQTIDSITDKPSADAANIAREMVTTKAMLDMSGMFKKLLGGPGKGGKDGLISLLSILSSLLAGPLGWIISTFKNILDGNWTQILENSFRRGIIAKALNPLIETFLKKTVKPAFDMFTDNIKPMFEGIQKYVIKLGDSKFFKDIATNFERTFKLGDDVFKRVDNIFKSFAVKMDLDKGIKNFGKDNANKPLSKIMESLARRNLPKNAKDLFNKTLFGDMVDSRKDNLLETAMKKFKFVDGLDGVSHLMQYEGDEMMSNGLMGNTQFKEQVAKRLADPRFAKMTNKQVLKQVGKWTKNMNWQNQVLKSNVGVAGVTSAMTQGGFDTATKPNIVTKILRGIQDILNSDKVLKMLGEKGAKVIKKLGPFFTALGKRLGTIIIGKTTLAKIMSRIAGGPMNIAFCAYDLSSGMAEAANIFKVSGSSVTWKMRFVSGISKMISGAILFGLIPDSWIASILWTFVADESEQEAVSNANSELRSEWEKYKQTTGKNISFDEYNDKIANKRIFTKVVDGVKGFGSAVGGAFGKGMKATGDFFNWAGSGLNNTIFPAIGNFVMKGIEGLVKNITAPFKTIVDTVKDLKHFFDDGFFAGIEKLGRNLVSFGVDLAFIPLTPIAYILETVGGFFGFKFNIKDSIKGLINPNTEQRAKQLKDAASIKIVTKIPDHSDSMRGSRSFGRGIENISSIINPTSQVNGLSHFTQNDARWATSKYGPRDSMKDSGCAPTVAADLIKNYNQKRNNISPLDAAKFAVENGFKLRNNGTDPKFFAAIGRKFNIKIIPGIKTKDAILAQLRMKRPVIVMGRRIALDSAYLGSNMHYMLLTAYDESKQQVVILDPSTDKIRYASIESVIKDTKLCMFTEAKGQGMLARFIPDKSIDNNSSYSTRQGSVGPISKNTQEFISKVLGGAISGFKKYGVLPSLTLAQAILESGSGKHAIGNNIFGIKAGSLWNGLKQYVMTHEYVNGVKQMQKSFFRDYNSVDASIEDHARLLTNNRYANVLRASDYKTAAYAVHKAGYATDPKYPNKLIEIIERYGLNKYDDPSIEWGHGMGKAKETFGPKQQIIPKNLGGLPFFYQKDPRWNDLAYGPSTIGKSGCASVALATISSAYKYPVTPINIAAFANKSGVITADGGTTAKLFDLWSAKSGIDFSTVANKPGMEKNIKDALMRRKPIIMMGQNYSGTPFSPYNSTRSHYVVASGYDDRTKMVTIVDGETMKSKSIHINDVMRDTALLTFTGKKGVGILGYDPLAKMKADLQANKAKKSNIKSSSSTKNSNAIYGPTAPLGMDNASNPNYDPNAVSSSQTSGGLTGLDAVMASLGTFMGASANMRWDVSSPKSKTGFTEYFRNKMAAALNGDSSSSGSMYTPYGDGETVPKEAHKELKNATESNPILPLGKYGIAFKTKSGSYVLGDTDIHEFFGNRLEEFAKNGLKRPLKLSDGSRTRSEQNILYNKFGPGRAASPWKMSNHYTGLAADVAGLENIPEALLNKYKLFRPFLNGAAGVQKEPWHVQPIETKGLDARTLEYKYGKIIDWGKGSGYTGNDLLGKVASDINWHYDNATSNSTMVSYKDNLEATSQTAQTLQKDRQDSSHGRIVDSAQSVSKSIVRALENNDSSALISAVTDQTKLLTEALLMINSNITGLRDETREEKKTFEKEIRHLKAGSKLTSKTAKNAASPARTGLQVTSGKGGDLLDSIIRKEKR